MVARSTSIPVVKLTMRVDFYLLRDPRKQVETLCCQLCAKAFDDRHTVAVLCGNEDQATQLDQWLWQVPPQRFIPHGRAGTAAARGSVVLINSVAPDSQIVINLSGGEHAVELPAQHHVQRILEIVADDDTARAQARRRYRHYQQSGAELHTHELG